MSDKIMNKLLKNLTNENYLSFLALLGCLPVNEGRVFLECAYERLSPAALTSPEFMALDKKLHS